MAEICVINEAIGSLVFGEELSDLRLMESEVEGSEACSEL